MYVIVLFIDYQGTNGSSTDNLELYVGVLRGSNYDTPPSVQCSMFIFCIYSFVELGDFNLTNCKYYEENLMIRNGSSCFSVLEKEKVIDSFVKQLIQDGIINIFLEDSSVNYDLLSNIDSIKLSCFGEVEFLSSSCLIE